MTEGTCSIEGCDGTGKIVRTWCLSHYRRWKNHGDPLAGNPTPVRQTSETCSVDACDTPPRSRGLCSSHWNRWKRYGDPLADPRVPPVQLLACCILGCRPNAAALFWLKVNKTSSCWVWTAGLNANGYGRYSPSHKGIRVLAHKWAYVHLVGPVPDGLELDHLCRNRACVNPAHLEPVTHEENVRRAYAHA